jgi:predicted nucleotidyltransferase component of viral defense system
MNNPREVLWQSLLTRALAILDSATAAGLPSDEWSFGGGTVLMLQYRHRFSKDIDIFVPDPQPLGLLTPRLCDAAEVGMTDYIEQRESIKIYFPEGEVDFVAAGSVTDDPFSDMVLLGRTIKTERPTEIVGKKLVYRAADFKARDVFDLALVLEREPEARTALKDLVARKRAELERRLTHRDAELREDFALIDVLEYAPTYDHCLEAIHSALLAGC